MRNYRWNFILLALFTSTTSQAKVNLIDITKKTAENQVRHLLEPVLDKFCHESCKLMSVSVSVDIAVNEEIAPGFDEVEARKTNELAPTAAQAKILIDDKVGPISRNKLLDLLQQYLDTLDFPVKIDTQIAHFPLPQGSESKIADLRDRITKQFISSTEDLLRQFCPNHCLLADYNLQADVVNGEEAQYGGSGEFIQDGDTAIRIKGISATLMMDEALTKDEQNNLLEMARLKTNSFKNVVFNAKVFKFPHPAPIPVNRTIASMPADSNGEDSKNSTNANNKTQNTSTASNIASEKNVSQKNTSENTSSNNTKQERFERIEKIERVENGDAVQAELQKFKVFGLIFSCSVLALLIFIAMTHIKFGSGSADQGPSRIQRVIESITSDPITQTSSQSTESLPNSDISNSGDAKLHSVSKRYEIELLTEELTAIYAQQPKVAKHVFTRILTEEGVETTSECIHIFGEGIVIDMLRDPSLQSDLNQLMEFYAKNSFELNDNEKLDLLRKLNNRTIAGKLALLGNRSSNIFDFLSEMDGLQILELVRTESLTVKSIVLTQCDPQKRSVVYAQMSPEIRMQLLTELSRIDYLPRDYIFNVATALKRKKRENPRLNTEALPGSEVLVSLLERTGQSMQRNVVKTLEASNPDSARTLMGKLVSIDTLKYLRDGQLLEVVLSLKHDELIQFLKGSPDEVRTSIFAKSPKDLVLELEDELAQVGVISREVYQGIERKILNRIKVMSNEGHINLIETNERMFSGDLQDTSFIQTTAGIEEIKDNVRNIKKVAGW